MNEKAPPKQKIIFVLTLFILFFGGLAMAKAQTTPGIALFWDQQVGCQQANFDAKRTIDFDDIATSGCLLVCNNSTVNYELLYMPVGATTVWTVAGGTVIASSNEIITVLWENVGFGNISISIQLPGSTVTKTLCIEKIEGPTALFEIVTQTNPEYFETCSQQPINFINLSSPNNGSDLDSYFWDFGDGNYSTEFEPVHSYLNDGNYTVTLKVINDCYCTEKFQMKILAQRRGVEISCPTVVCEGQSAIYSLPFDAENLCSGNLNWSAIGGQIISQVNGTAEVLWNNVDELGFGYVTFNPENCDLDCREATTVKVPVIQVKGTIQGPTELCLKEQGRYKLPQWPTTDIQWEIVGNNNNDLGEIILTDQRNEIVVFPLSPGILTLRAVYTNTLLQCSGEAEFQITVGAPLEILGESSFCQNSTGIFSNSENASVNWTIKDESGATLSNTTAVDFSYFFSLPGTYTLSGTAPDYCGIDDKVIVVLPTPEMPSGIDGLVEVCPNTPYSYSVPNPDANSVYTWVVTNGTVLGSNTGDEVNITFTGIFPATVAVTRKTVNPIECISAPKEITINQVPVNAVLSPGSSVVCSSSIHTYKAFEAGTSTLFADGDTYTWSLSDPSLGSVTTGQGTTEVEILWNEVDQVTPVNLILTIGKCTLSPSPQFIKSITINPKAQIKIQSLQNPVCAGPLYNVVYTVSSINGVALNPATDAVTWNLGTGEYTTGAGVFSQSRTFVNNGSTNIDYIVSAVIANANGCGTTNKAFFTTTVLPNPPAVASLNSAANAFCLSGDVNAQIIVSSNTVGVTFQWFKNGVLIPGQTGTSLSVGSALNFGSYTFKVTSQNGCIRESNNINIYQFCGEPPSCTITASVQNTSSLTSCNTIAFSAITSPAPISSSWVVLGTGTGNFSVTGNTLTGKPGVYTIIHKAVYPCQAGGTGIKPTSKQVIIPYAPDFSYITQCNPNNTFNVNFIDNSNFFSGLSTQNFKFYYKAVGAANFTGPLVYNPALTVFEIQNLAAGAYIFKVENNGTYQGTTFPVCKKEYTVNLQGVSALTSIVVNETFDIGCHNTAVKFGLNPSPIGATVLWEFGDGAQNTSLNTQRVFNTPDTTYTVKCTIKNAFGCSIERFVNVYIPKKCFFGDIIANPADAVVCKDENVVLTYIPNSDNCTGSGINYIWMNGSTPIAGATNASTINVNQPGSYWVKVKSADDCEYNSPSQITPTFKKLPSVKINGQARYCENESIILSATTEADTIIWALDGLVYPQFNNLTETDWTGTFSPYDFVISCTVTKDGCTNTAFHPFTIEEEIQDILIDMAISCDPYQVVVYADAVSYSGAPVFFNWSNGASGWSDEPGGNEITVTDGGAFSVTATTGGGCSFTKQIDVPRSPQNYMWIFPTGCYADCTRVGNYLIGPLVPLSNWSWNDNGLPVESGSEFADPFPLKDTGNYSLSINTGACALESGILSFTANKCEECRIEEVVIKDIIPNETPYCSYTQILVIHSGVGQPFQATLSDPLNNVTIIPSTFTIFPGANNIQFTVIPQSPFVGGSTTLRIHGQIADRGSFIDCEFLFPIEIPFCENTQFRPSNNLKVENSESTLFKSCTLYPNPASSLVNLQYDLGVSNSTVELYELTGRLLTQQTLRTSKGTTAIPLSTFASGMYIVVVRDGNQILYQQKLIIK